MKTLNQYIEEKLVLNSNSKIRKQQEYNYHPKTNEELKKIVKRLITERGNEADLNDIDTSEITDMSYLFYCFTSFNGDISLWDVSGVKNMDNMFADSLFNGDISGWDVSKVINMTSMFYRSAFNGDISGWNVSNVTTMWGMFQKSKFNGDISNWNVNNVIDMERMFYEAEFNKDISKWKLNKDLCKQNMFLKCSIKKEYKPRKRKTV
jgi:surface protein